jgi:hypothetical protein
MSRLRSLAVGGVLGTVAVLALIPSSALGASTARWSLQHPTIPSGSVSTFPLAVGCPTGGACLAVGYYNLRISPQEVDQVAFAERWDGHRWNLMNVPVPSSAASLSELTGISCPAAGNCTAVGEYLANVLDVPTPLPLVEHWNGHTWTRQIAPSPTSVADAPLSSVSCSTASACTAVGHMDLPFGVREPFVETWDGHTWSITDSPGTDAELRGVACVRTGTCIAVGDQSLPVPVTLAERSTGGSWRVDDTPDPSDANFSYELGSVSCHELSSCVAVGTAPSNLSGGLSSNVVETWNGSTWSLQTVPVPVGGTAFNFLSSVSCPALHTCVAVGSAGASHDNWILGWDGTTWRLEPSPAPSSLANHGAVLTGVSCSAVNVCMAVGYYSGENFNEFPFAERSSPSSTTGTAVRLTISAATARRLGLRPALVRSGHRGGKADRRRRSASHRFSPRSAGARTGGGA